MTPEEFVAQCKTYVGVRFWHCGRSRTGVDCIGLVIAAAHDLGVDTYDEKKYNRHINPKKLADGIARHCDKVPSDSRQLGDILFFAPHHIGVDLGDGFFIHSWDKAGCVAESRMTTFWIARLSKAYRWKGW